MSTREEKRPPKIRNAFHKIFQSSFFYKLNQTKVIFLKSKNLTFLRNFLVK